MILLPFPNNAANFFAGAPGFRRGFGCFFSDFVEVSADSRAVVAVPWAEGSAGGGTGVAEAIRVQDGAAPRASELVRRRLRLVCLLAIAIAAGEAVLWLGRGAEATPWWVSAVYPLFYGAAGFRCFRSARRLASDERKTWLCFGLGCSGLAFAELVWGVYDSLLRAPLPNPSLSDAGYLAAPICFGIGVWHWRARTPTAWLSRVQLGNLGIIFSSILLACLFLFHQYMRAPVPRLSALAGIFEAVLDLSVALFGFVVVYLHLWSCRRAATMLILFALIANAAADVYYGYSLVNDGYDSTGLMNVFSFLVAAFVYWAAFEQDQLGVEAREQKLTQELEDRAKQWETLLPPFAFGAVLLVAFAFREGLHASMLPYVAAASLLFVVSLAVRNWWGHRTETQLRMRALASEAELQRSNRELCEEMQTRARIEEELRQSQKMEALGQLTGGVAHDFNNLLGVILGNLELADQGEQVPPSVRELLEEAAEAAGRGASLTQRLLALSRKQSLNPEPIDVCALLDGMRALLERSLGERIEVKLGGARAGLNCLADRSQLEGAILNLAINARDAMPSGGTLCVEASRVAIDEICSAGQAELCADEYIAISVRDTGLGIPPDLVERVFEPFFTTKEIGEGTGLGLSMVYGFARQSGGHVEIKTAYGEGTRVCLYLPISEAPPDSGHTVACSTWHRGRGESVLVVEDEPALRRLVVAYLENLGYAVVSVANGEESLSVIESMDSIDLLLSDVMLPGDLSGREIAAAIKRRRPEVKVLLMSGYADEVLTREGSLRSGDLLLHKPFQLNELARRVREVLEL